MKFVNELLKTGQLQGFPFNGNFGNMIWSENNGMPLEEINQRMIILLVCFRKFYVTIKIRHVYSRTGNNLAFVLLHQKKKSQDDFCGDWITH
jgi:hypothetical protein